MVKAAYARKRKDAERRGDYVTAARVSSVFLSLFSFLLWVDEFLYGTIF